MKIVADAPSGLSALDRPNSYIGRSVPRPNLGRLLQGRGQYVSDLVLPRMAHVAFVRSPHAHAAIKSIDSRAAKKAPGVIAVVTGRDGQAWFLGFIGKGADGQFIGAISDPMALRVAPDGRLVLLDFGLVAV